MSFRHRCLDEEIAAYSGTGVTTRITAYTGMTINYTGMTIKER